jgi:hypothetical protein
MPVEALALLLSGVLAAATAAPPKDAPDPELLEFLGTYETAGGQWIDPQTLDDDTRSAPPAPPPREEKQP